MGDFDSQPTPGSSLFETQLGRLRLTLLSFHALLRFSSIRGIWRANHLHENKRWSLVTIEDTTIFVFSWFVAFVYVFVGGILNI